MPSTGQPSREIKGMSFYTTDHLQPRQQQQQQQKQQHTDLQTTEVRRLTRYLNILPLHRRKVHIQRQPVPERVRLLPLQPVPAVVGERHVKVEDEAGEDESHLGVGEAITEKYQG